MQGLFDVKETGTICGTEDFDVDGRIVGTVGLEEVSGEVGFFGIIFGPIGYVFVDAGFKERTQWFDPCYWIRVSSTAVHYRGGVFQGGKGGIQGSRLSEGCAEIGRQKFGDAVGWEHMLTYLSVGEDGSSEFGQMRNGRVDHCFLKRSRPMSPTRLNPFSGAIF